MFRELPYKASIGLPALLILIVLMGVALAMIVNGGNSGQPAMVIAGVLTLVTASIALGGLCVANPGDG